MATSLIPATPGFNALTLCTNKAGRLSYQRESVIAWHISETDSIEQDRPSLSPFPVLPLEGVLIDFDAIEHPAGAVQTEYKTFKDIAEWLSYEEAKRAKP
ncbi:hypothetical protein [Methylomonas sp. TEB]|uniref:hypothetical protein n=1 Tax=Methylomonas sp. TEB TaxID=3398229 RepID=UPI0039F627E6